MPRRRKRVRVSVRKRSSSTNTDWNVEEANYGHSEFVILDFLVPISGREAFMMSRADFEADWVAGKKHMQPGTIEEGDRLVTFVGGSPELVLKVNKPLREGRSFKFILEEVGPVQS